jgi:hypothetical protein
MWDIQAAEIPKEWFEPFVPVEVLDEYDGPRIFTLKDSDGELNLSYWSDEYEQASRYVVVPTTARILTALKDGSITVFDALNQPRCWLCDVSQEGDLTNCFRVEFDAIPRDVLPAFGTMLHPSLEPLLTIRAVGDEIVAGRIPGSVIRTCVEGVQKTFKFLSEYVLGQQTQAGRPDEFLRRLFDLPTQRVAFASFEISFRMPIEEKNLFTAAGEKSPERETLEQVGALLNKGLKWLTSAAGEEGVYSPDAPEEGAVLLRALKELTPSSQGSIERLELKGQLIGTHVKTLVLERSARQRVNNAIRNRSLEPELVDLKGRVRELDKDRLSFELREIESTGAQTQRFVFDEELLEDVFQAFQDDMRVRVAGRTFPVKNVAYALALSRVPVMTAIRKEET